MAESALYARIAAPRLIEALEDSPVVLIHGPRQCGKTTLARTVGDRLGYAYISFDDDVARLAAEADPVGFVSDLPETVILDEVQRVPALFPALKLAVDRKRRAGRFLLTGSANVLLLPKLGDSMAGRMRILRLHPLSQTELERANPEFLGKIFGKGFKTRQMERLHHALAERIATGGYPSALRLPAGRRRAAWYRDYIEALVQRDVRDLARIGSLDTLPRLLAAAAAQTGRLQNITDLSAPFQQSRQTIRDYVTLLERVFLIDTLPPWHSNRMSRLVKTPKLHVGDTGLACALLGIDGLRLSADRDLLGQLLETFVYQELKRQADASDMPVSFFHFRDRDGVEVDIVMESERQLAGVEIKAAATVTPSDFRGLRKLAETAGKRFAAGVVLYDGEMCARFGDNLFAVPLRMLWEA